MIRLARPHYAAPLRVAAPLRRRPRRRPDHGQRVVAALGPAGRGQPGGAGRPAAGLVPRRGAAGVRAVGGARRQAPIRRQDTDARIAPAPARPDVPGGPLRPPRAGRAGRGRCRTAAWPGGRRPSTDAALLWRRRVAAGRRAGRRLGPGPLPGGALRGPGRRARAGGAASCAPSSTWPGTTPCCATPPGPARSSPPPGSLRRTTGCGCRPPRGCGTGGADMAPADVAAFEAIAGRELAAARLRRRRARRRPPPPGRGAEARRGRGRRRAGLGRHPRRRPGPGSGGGGVTVDLDLRPYEPSDEERRGRPCWRPRRGWMTDDQHRGVLRLEAHVEPVRKVAGLGGDRRRPGRRASHVPALGVRPGRPGLEGGAGGRHRHPPGPPGPGAVHPADPPRPRRVGERRRGLRVQHPQRTQPARVPQDGLGGRRPAAGLARPRSPAVAGPSGPGQGEGRRQVVRARRAPASPPPGRWPTGRAVEALLAALPPADGLAHPPDRRLPGLALRLRAARLPGRDRARRAVARAWSCSGCGAGARRWRPRSARSWSPGATPGSRRTCWPGRCGRAAPTTPCASAVAGAAGRVPARAGPGPDADVQGRAAGGRCPAASRWRLALGDVELM